MGGFERGLVTILRRADTESARRSNAGGQIGRRSAHREQMSWSGSAGMGGRGVGVQSRLSGNVCEDDSESTLPLRGKLVPHPPTPVMLPVPVGGA